MICRNILMHYSPYDILMAKWTPNATIWCWTYQKTLILMMTTTTMLTMMTIVNCAGDP